RKWRLEARLALLAFQRLQQRGFFAADISTKAMEGMQRKIEPGIQDVVAQETGLGRLLERFIKPLVDFKNLAVNVVVANVNAHGISGNGHAFNHYMRIEAQDVTVFECAGLSLVRVADQIFLTRQAARHETPLQARRESGTTTT